MPRVTPVEMPTRVVLCFFVNREQRGRKLTLAVLKGTVDYARGQCAQVIEGYPFDTAGITSTHRGHSIVFKAAGFRQDGSRWVLRLRARKSQVGCWKVGLIAAEVNVNARTNPRGSNQESRFCCVPPPTSPESCG